MVDSSSSMFSAPVLHRCFSAAATVALAMVVVLRWAPAAPAQELTWPPQLPSGARVVTDRSEEMLRRPEGFPADIDVARVPPTIDFFYLPEQNYPGRPWSAWGDSLFAKGRYYTSIGDHGAPHGNAFVFEYDPESQQVRTLVNVERLLNLPSDHYTPGKIHSRLDMGRDGRLYFATHRGSTRVTTDEFHYQGDWIIAVDPQTAEAEIIAQGPVPRHCIPTSVLDPERMIFYGGTAAGDRTGAVMFFAYDIPRRRVLHTAPNGPYRYLIFARSTGRVYYVNEDGATLMRYDPASGRPPEPVEGTTIGLRSATQETPSGHVYTVSSRGDATLWRFDVRTERAEAIGSAAVGSESYVASLDADPSGRFLYYVPGAHGGGYRVGSPVIQYDIKTGRKKVLAFLHPFYQKRYGYTPLGTYSLAVDDTGSRLMITWNGNRSGPDRRGRLAFDTCAVTVIHIPDEER